MNITVRGLRSPLRRLDGRLIVDAAQLLVPACSVTVVVGRSGAGKSTLLDLITGITRAAAGSVQLGPHTMQPASPSQRARLRARVIASARQDGDLLDALTVEENVGLGQRLSGQRNSPLMSHVLDALAVPAATRDAFVTSISGGERRRVAIARAVASGTPCIACDEPTTALDEHSADRVRTVLRQSADSGRTVLVVSHDPALARRADRLVGITEGRISRVIDRPSAAAVDEWMGTR